MLEDLPVEISTVDGFQGCDKEMIVISFVRSNPKKNVGFLNESRRINVSVTRAKRCCVVVGDISTLKDDSGIHSFIDYCQDQNVIVKVFEYLENIESR